MDIKADRFAICKSRLSGLRVSTLVFKIGLNPPVLELKRIPSTLIFNLLDISSAAKLDIKPTSAITAEVTSEQLRADMYVATSRRGDWVRLEKYGTRIYFNDLIRDQGKLFKDMFNLKGEIQYGISIDD